MPMDRILENRERQTTEVLASVHSTVWLRVGHRRKMQQYCKSSEFQIIRCLSLSFLPSKLSGLSTSSLTPCLFSLKRFTCDDSQANKIYLEYAFASEEYNEYVRSRTAKTSYESTVYSTIPFFFIVFDFADTSTRNITMYLYVGYSYYICQGSKYCREILHSHRVVSVQIMRINRESF
jgi:hypothetical protein